MQQHPHAFKFTAAEVSTEGLIEGFGSVFGNVDQGLDVVQAGAFEESLREWKALDRLPAMLWQHNTAQPIGTWKEVRETSRGLFVAGQLAIGTTQGRDVYELLKTGALDGMSIGYDVLPGGARFRDDGVRVLTRLKLWEVSLVTFGMNEAARVTDVKSAGHIGSARELQELLRERLGLSGKKARRVAGIAWHAIHDEEVPESDDQHQQIAELRSVLSIINSQR